MIANQPDQKLRELAIEVVSGTVFTSTGLDATQIQQHFYPVLFGGLNTQLTYTKDNPDAPDRIGMVYEEVHKALPMGVNGKPVFTSCKVLNAHDTKQLQHYVEMLLAQQEAFVKE